MYHQAAALGTDTWRDVFGDMTVKDNSNRCRHGIRIWNGDQPRCAFDPDGTFQHDNWSCRLMDRLRSLVSPYNDPEIFPRVWSEDQNVGVISFNGSFAILSWYKERGKTEGFWVVEGSEIRPGTENDAYDVLAYNLKAAKEASDDTEGARKNFMDEFGHELPVDGFKWPRAKRTGHE